MSILGAMFTAVSGVNAQSRAIGHISDNIANSQSTGYKKVDTRFETLITVSNSNLHAPGGVIASPYFANGLQGNITQTQSLSNLAISGNGFFIVSRADTTNGSTTTFNNLPYYTRAGDFELNRDGFLVNNGQYYLNGWQVDEDTGLPDTATLAPIQITQVIDQPTPTAEIEFVGNLPASSEVNPTPPLGPTNIQIFDALGSPHTVSLVWAKRADNIWKLDIQAPGSTLDPVSGTIVGVNDQAPTGATTTANVPPVAQVDTVTIPTPAGIAAGDTVTFTIGSNSISITAPVGGYNPAQAAAALVAAINGNPGLSAVVTAGNVGANTFDVVADVGGTPFTATVGGTGGATSANTTANTAAVAQIDTITLAGTVGGSEIGDTWSLNIGSVTVTYTNDGTEASLNDVAAGFADLINANPSIGVTATAIGGTVQIQANTAGVPFTATVAATNGSTPGFLDVQFGQTTGTAGTVVQVSNAFNLSGNATVPPAQTAGQPVDVTFVVDYGTGPQTITLNLGQFQTTNGLTQFAGSNIDVSRFTQDGVPQGLFKDLNIRDNGDVELNYDNGRSRVFFKVPLAQFFDPTGLRREVAQGFLETFDSGAPRISEAGDNGAGTLRGSAIEGSNVDIAEEFSKMIVTQRAYAANTRVITTADEMLQEVINIKR
jgi:flagellar hook protein FlgE